MIRPLLLLSLALSGCDTHWDETVEGDWRLLKTTVRSNNAGDYGAIIQPKLGETSMLTTVRPLDDLQDCHIRFLEQSNQVPFRADEEVKSKYSRTNAGYIGHTVSLNWPISAADPELNATRSRVQIGVVSRELKYERGDVELNVLLKNDSDLTQGTVRINLIYSGTTGAQSDIVSATEQAIELWREIYREIGIELDIQLYDYVGPGVLQAPGQGSDEDYLKISRETPFGGINLVVVEELTGIEDVFGFAGDIPGPMIPSERSAVAVNVGLGAGTDGLFSAGEVELLAETMAHETGHYLGLYHPVEVSYDAWDALDDTVECQTEISCIDLIGRNLMFPFPVCNSTSCIPQNQITDEQQGVAHRYAGVL